ncbi:uncharacterized protein METZ01_LOCUS311212, partial [marine metagenome]
VPFKERSIYRTPQSQEVCFQWGYRYGVVLTPRLENVTNVKR